MSITFFEIYGSVKSGTGVIAMVYIIEPVKFPDSRFSDPRAELDRQIGTQISQKFSALLPVFFGVNGRNVISKHNAFTCMIVLGKNKPVKFE